MALFGLGILVGGILTIVLLALTLRIMNRAQAIIDPSASTGNPEITVTLSQGLLQRLIDDSLRDVALPLITLRDPRVELEPDAVIVLRLRGDTVLLGAQAIVLRMRLSPAPAGVQVATETAEVGFLGNVAGPLTATLDEQINEELARRLAFAGQFEVLDVSGTTREVLVQARLRD